MNVRAGSTWAGPTELPRAPGHEFGDDDAPGLHIDLGDADVNADDDEPDSPARYAELEVLIDAFVECFNARDLEGLTGLLASDVELPGLGADGAIAALVRCWDARPNAMLSRGLLSDEPDTDGWWSQPVALQWDLDEAGGWRRSALLAFAHDDGPDGGSIGLVEYVGDVAIMDEVVADPPERDIPAGSSWAQWEEGTD